MEVSLSPQNVVSNRKVKVTELHQSRDLRDDPAWINASNYGAPNLMFIGEIGKRDDTRFIETTKLKKGQESNAVDVFQAVLFGDKYFGMAVSLPVELRDAGVIDYGRERGLAWYSIMGAGILHAKHGALTDPA